MDVMTYKIAFQTGVELNDDGKEIDFVSGTIGMEIDALLKKGITTMHHFNSKDVYLMDGQPAAHAAILAVKDRRKNSTHKDIIVCGFEEIKLRDMRGIFVRGDDIQQIIDENTRKTIDDLLHIYSKLPPANEGGPVMINPLDATYETTQKYRLWELGQDDLNLPLTYLATNLKDALDAASEIIKNPRINDPGNPPSDIIVKKPEGFGGKHVHKISACSQSFTEELSRLLAEYKKIIIQEYNPLIVQTGDIRVELVDGEIIGWFNRKGKDDCFITNLYKGGLYHPCELSEEAKKYCRRVAQKFERVFFIGLDVLKAPNGKETCLEVNGHPAGGKYIKELQGVDIADILIAKAFPELSAGISFKKDVLFVR